MASRIGLLACVACAVLVIAGPRAASPQRGRAAGLSSVLTGGTGVITGQLLERDSGAPVPNGVVTLSSAAPTVPGTPPPEPLRTLTADDGQFVFHSLVRGSYQVSAERPGFVSTSMGQPLVVEDGKRVATVTIRILKYGSISGTVRDETGEPVVGANVRLFMRAIEAGAVRYRFFSNQRTDDRGVYRFSEVSPTDYLVAVPLLLTSVPLESMVAYLDAMGNAPAAGNQVANDIRSSGGSPLSASGIAVGGQLIQFGGAARGGLPTPLLIGDGGRTFVYPTTFHPAGHTTATAAVVAVRSGQARTGIDIAVTPVPAVRVSGVVTGPNGPVANHTVKFVPGGMEALTQMSAIGSQTAEAITRRDGTFTAVGVPAGDYRVSVQRISGQVSTDTVAPGKVIWGRAQVSVGDRDMEGVAIGLSPGLTIAGRITFEPGAIEPPPPAAVGRMRIQIRTPDLASMGGSGTVTVSADGSFKSAELAPATYTLTVTSVPTGWTRKSIIVNGRDVADAFELDTSLSDVTLTYTDRGGDLSGSITGMTAGAATMVLLVPVDRRSPGGFDPRRLRQSTARTNTFRFANVLPGEYAVVAVSVETPDALEDRVVADLARLGSRVTIADRDKKTVTLAVVTRR